MTGSGKTEVYLQLIRATLEAGRQALLLIPEINLGPQTLGRFEQRFNARIALLHSALTDRERMDIWLAAAMANWTSWWAPARRCSPRSNTPG